MRHFLTLTLVGFLATPVQADITVGVCLPLTGPSSALGLAFQKQLKLWPEKIAGEKVNVIVLDDATDPAAGVANARKLTGDYRVDVVLGSTSAPVSVAMADTLAEAGTVQLSAVPSVLAADKDRWHFRLAQSSQVMAQPVLAHMQRKGVKSVAFLGYSTSYGESWLKELQALAPRHGININAVERFGLADTSVTGQVLKVTSARPDAVLVVAAGSGAGMPQRALVERGYPGLIYQTHGAASQDLIRVAGKDVEGTFLVAGPLLVAEQLPASHPSKAAAMAFVTQFEKVHGPGTRSAYAAHAFDAMLVLERAVPLALKTAKPGTDAFRAALRNALETMGPVSLSQGVLEWTPTDHWGYRADTPVMVKIVGGAWQLQ